MKVLGHPLHMMLIHFPTALLPMDVLLSFFAYYNNDNSFLPAAFYCVVAGVLVGAAAIITGTIDVLLIKKDKKPAIATAVIHGFVNTIVLLFFGIFAYRGWQLYPEVSMPQTATLITKAVLIIILFGGNYLGGKLILHHHIGLKNNIT
jgi:uncharacterized membrane protein